MTFPTEHTAAREGFDVYYRVFGAGAPVLILAGGPGFDCDYMEPVARELAGTRQAILVELRGTGRSMPPAITPETINTRETLADLEAIREQISLDGWTLAGHSAGAVLAMAYAIHFPQRVTSLVLMNSGPIRYASAGVEMENIKKRLTPGERDALQKASHSDFGQMLAIILPGYFYDRSQASRAASQLRPDQYHAKTGSLINRDIMPPGTDLRPALRDFPRPVLVVAGREDPQDANVQHEIHQAFKNSTLHLINNCGHFSWIEQPQEFYRALREFIGATRIAC